jgi:hypothetical protein
MFPQPRRKSGGKKPMPGTPIKKNEKKKRKKKRKTERKIERLNLKNIQNVRKFFLNIFLLGFWPKKFLTGMKLIHFLKSVSVNFFYECSSEGEAKDLFGCTK